MPDLITNARKFLESLERYDLSALLGPCEAAIEKSITPQEIDFDWVVDVEEDVLIVRAPKPIDEALKVMAPQDRKRIAQALTSTIALVPTPDDIAVESLPGAEAEGASALLAELLIHRAMMVSVATGGERIQEVDDYYRAREARVRRSLPEPAE